MKRRCTHVEVWRDTPEQETPYRRRCALTLTGNGEFGLCSIHQRLAARQPVRVVAFGGEDIRVMVAGAEPHAIVMYDTPIHARRWGEA